MNTGRKIAVLIEPDRSLSYVMTAVLKRHEFDVIVAEAVDVALKRMQGHAVKIILVAEEIKTPRYDGIDVARAVNSTYKGRIPIVITSRRPTEESVIRSIKAGALEFIVKPSEENMLIKKIETAMNRGNTQFIIADNIKDLPFEEGMSLSEMIDVVIAEADEIRALPQAVVKITQVSDDARSGASAMERAISSDPGITGMVLKRANSAYYKGQSQIKSVKQAVVRIGFNECRKMVLGFSVFKLFSKDDKSFGFNRLQFWLHSVSVSVLAELLLKKAGNKKPEDGFLSGLLHDFGKLLLDDYLSAHFQRAIQLSNINNLTLYEAENKVFERTHSAVSKAIMDKWNFPEHISTAALRHHVVPRPDPKAGIPADLNSALFLANQMAKVGLLGSGGDAIATPIPDGMWRAFKIEEELFDPAFMTLYFEKVSEFLEFLGINAEEIGRVIELPTGKGKILVLREKGDDIRLLNWFLQCQGFEVVIVKDVDSIPADEEFVKAILNSSERADLDEMCKMVFQAYPDLHMIALTGKMRYTNSLVPPASLKVMEGRIDFRMLRLGLR